MSSTNNTSTPSTVSPSLKDQLNALSQKIGNHEEMEAQQAIECELSAQLARLHSALGKLHSLKLPRNRQLFAETVKSSADKFEMLVTESGLSKRGKSKGDIQVKKEPMESTDLPSLPNKQSSSSHSASKSAKDTTSSRHSVNPAKTSVPTTPSRLGRHIPKPEPHNIQQQQPPAYTAAQSFPRRAVSIRSSPEPEARASSKRKRTDTATSQRCKQEPGATYEEYGDAFEFPTDAEVRELGISVEQMKAEGIQLRTRVISTQKSLWRHNKWEAYEIARFGQTYHGFDKCHNCSMKSIGIFAECYKMEIDGPCANCMWNHQGCWV